MKLKGPRKLVNRRENWCVITILMVLFQGNLWVSKYPVRKANTEQGADAFDWNVFHFLSTVHLMLWFQHAAPHTHILLIWITSSILTFENQVSLHCQLCFDIENENEIMKVLIFKYLMGFKVLWCSINKDNRKWNDYKRHCFADIVFYGL